MKQKVHSFIELLMISGIFNQNLGVGGSSDKEEIVEFQSFLKRERKEIMRKRKPKGFKSSYHMRSYNRERWRKLIIQEDIVEKYRLSCLWSILLSPIYSTVTITGVEKDIILSVWWEENGIVNSLNQSAEVRGKKMQQGCMKRKQNACHSVTWISLIIISHREWTAFSFQKVETFHL